MTEAEAPTPNEFCFGSFRLLRDQRLLLKSEKEELFARVWPKQFVEEGNLKFHVATLRKALGDGQDGNRFIANVPGRGYCFVGPVQSPGRAASACRTPPRGRKACPTSTLSLPGSVSRNACQFASRSIMFLAEFRSFPA
jgi:DNA-binding winged helix-turn-helix (wHTH) protein